MIGYNYKILPRDGNGMISRESCKVAWEWHFSASKKRGANSLTAKDTLADCQEGYQARKQFKTRGSYMMLATESYTNQNQIKLLS